MPRHLRCEDGSPHVSANELRSQSITKVKRLFALVTSAFQSDLDIIMAERRVAQIAGHLFPKGMLAG